MKIALLGYGKMGQLIDQLAQQKNYQIIARLNSKESISHKIQEADVWIDFSHPDCVIKNIEYAITCQKPLIMGTTGWYDQLPQIQKQIEHSSIGFLYAANFSVGVHLFSEIVAEAARLFNPHVNYDVALSELHHHQKFDHPSGTAKTIAQQIVAQMPRKKTLDISSVRCGNIPGTHTVYFDSAEDTITLSHTARNRVGFAQGALLAAEWIKDKKGFFTIQDVIKGISP